MFNRFACFWPKSYRRGSLSRRATRTVATQKQAMQKSYPVGKGFEPVALDYLSTALRLELEMMSLRMLNFGYLNPVL